MYWLKVDFEITLKEDRRKATTMDARLSSLLALINTYSANGTPSETMMV